MKRILIVSAGAFTLLLVLLLGRALTMKSRQVEVEPVKPTAIDTDAVIGRLSESLRFETVSHEEEGWNPEPFRRFLAFIDEKYPLVRSRLTKEVVGGYTLLYTWKGRSSARLPVLLLSHYDVVPIVPGTENQWTHPPFGGKVADGYVWGRGSLDDKFGVMAILEAVELLLGEGFEPEATIYLSFGHDEELGGPAGAQRVAELLGTRGVKLDFVIDEGGALIQGMVPGVDGPVAAIGVAEKGSVTVEMIARAAGGHSSSPPPHTAIGILSTAIHKLERNQMPAELRGAALHFFEFAAPEMPFLYRIVMGNRWLFGGVLEAQLESLSPATNATVRTTTAATVISGGVKSNVLPTDARAVVNFRILPGDTIEGVVQHVKDAIEDPTIEVRALGDARPPSGVSPIDTPSFVLLQRTIRQLFPDAIVTPYLTVGGTDSRYFDGLTANIYKFAPIIAEPSDLTRMHGIDERMSVANYVSAVQFFLQLLRNTREAT